ncbi:MAG: hypothetical protein ABIZ70_09875 [Gemmatimonadales bacterium]
MSEESKPNKDRRDTAATTRREETPALEGREPLPEELTGRASGTTEDLATLFENESASHLKDGFRGGSDDDRETDALKADSEEIQQSGDNSLE